MKILIFSLLPFMVLGNITLIEKNSEDKRIDLLISLVAFNLKNNGRDSIFTFGRLPDSFYNKIKRLPFGFITSSSEENDVYIDDVVSYHPNMIIIECFNFTDFETNLRRMMRSPYWFPPSSLIILYSQADKHEIAKVFYILWFFRVTKSILIQHDDTKNLMYISEFNPFVVGVTANIFGCRTTRTVGMPIENFKKSFVCEDTCDNVAPTTKNRHLRLGTCLELKTTAIPYNDRKGLTKKNFFEDKGKNMNGFGLRTFTTEVAPFLIINDLGNGTFELGSRDGTLWTNLAKLMNFTIDLSPSLDVLKKFNFDVNIKHIFSVAQRKGDLFLIPIYQFDVIVVELDYSFPYKDSGVCILSHKASFKTVLLDLKTIRNNFNFILEFGVCLTCICLVFLLYSALEGEKITANILGKSFSNMVRSSLSITLYRPPKVESFRIFHLIILWCFFVINFSTQASFVSFFTVLKRGHEVDTFADTVKVGYPIQGISSPDVVLPDDNEIFRKFNSKLEPIEYMYSCVEELADDIERFCLLDCSVARYMRLNKLDSKGEQFLHIAKDRIHSYYLNLVFPKYSVFTESVDRYLKIFYEAGLIRKWEDFRYDDIKPEKKVRALGMRELQGIFFAYFVVVSLTFWIFMVEVLIVRIKIARQYLMLRMNKWMRTRSVQKITRMEQNKNQFSIVSSSTQTST